MLTYLYLCGLACLLTHELDAIDQKEWRFFFGWTPLNDTDAYRLFTALHIPLLVWIIANIFSPSFQLGLCIFMLIHLGLHVWLRKHPAIQFNNWFSWVWIGGAALFGAIYIIIRSIAR